MNCDTTGEGVYMNVSLRGSQYNVFEVLISTGLLCLQHHLLAERFIQRFIHNMRFIQPVCCVSCSIVSQQLSML